MRSEHVFAAAKTICNRFLLCRVASATTHRLQLAGKPFTETISKSLREIAAIARPEQGTAKEPRTYSDFRFLASGRDVTSMPLQRTAPALD